MNAMKITQLVTGLVLLALVGVMFFTTTNMKYMIGGTPGPRFMPLVLSVALSILIVIYWIEAYAARNEEQKSPWDVKALPKPLTFLAICIGLVILWNPLGALPSVFLAAVAELKLLEKRTWNRAHMLSFIMTVFTWALFGKALAIQFPAGILRGII